MSTKETQRSIVAEKQISKLQKVITAVLRGAPLAAVAISVVGVWIQLANLNATLKREADAADEASLRQWQMVIVYEIIQGARLDGIDFSSIRREYVTRAQQLKDFPVPVEELSDLALRAVIMDLQQTQLVFLDAKGGYTSNSVAINPRYDRSFIEEQAKYALLSLLTTDGGRYSVDELRSKLTESTSITNQEFDKLFNDMVTTRQLRVVDNRVWSSAHPPEPKPNEK